ncbi:MAG: type II toxin-antitoxin system RelE/ParE family toxin [Patescibacteria group bacterium]
MNWTVLIDGYAKKYLKRISRKDADRIRETLKELQYNPYAGDIEKVEGQKDAWRRRIGSYRILYEVYGDKKIIYVSEIKRRTSSTY